MKRAWLWMRMTDVCQHIAALWPTEDALHFIEECLVYERRTG
jgi:hypothetical protein